MDFNDEKYDFYREKLSSYEYIGISSKDSLKLIYQLLRPYSNEKTLIPNLSAGELSLCAEKWDGFIDPCFASDDELLLSMSPYKNSILISDFLKADIKRKYKTILLLPKYMGSRDKKYFDICIDYLRKSISLLDEEGILIADFISLVASVPRFHEIRQLIRESFSLEASMIIEGIPHVHDILLVLRKGVQNSKVFFSYGISGDEINENLLCENNGFFVDSSELVDRFDPPYYEPQYQRERLLLQNENMISLGTIADVFYGQQSGDGTTGDYFVLCAEHLDSGHIDTSIGRQQYLKKENINREKSILQYGDVVIAIIACQKIKWGIFFGEANSVIASQSLVVIRGKDLYSQWIGKFFSSRVGYNYLQSQFEYLLYRQPTLTIHLETIRQLVVPNESIISTAIELHQLATPKERIAQLFSERGWEVQEEYFSGIFNYDIALFESKKLKGVILITPYTESQLFWNEELRLLLEKYQNDLGEVSIFLFIESSLCMYDKGIISQLPEIPSSKKSPNHSFETFDFQLEENRLVFKECSTKSTADSYLIETLLKEILVNQEKEFQKIGENQKKIQDSIEIISNKMDLFLSQLSDFQSLSERLLSLASTPEEEERIIKGFSEECIERIENVINEKNNSSDFEVATAKMKQTFSEPLWLKVDEEAKKALVTADIVYDFLRNSNGDPDYAGVCILATRALEIELTKRFYSGFIKYLKQEGIDYSNWPTQLVTRIRQRDNSIKWQIRKMKDFTLGTVPFLFCYKYKEEVTDEQRNNDESMVIAYTRKELMPHRSEESVSKILKEFAKLIDEVSNECRNPSAHRDVVNENTATNCLNILLYVRRLLIGMMSVFEN